MEDAGKLLRESGVEVNLADHRTPEEIMEHLQQLGVLAVGKQDDPLPYFVR